MKKIFLIPFNIFSRWTNDTFLAYHFYRRRMTIFTCKKKIYVKFTYETSLYLHWIYELLQKKSDECSIRTIENSSVSVGIVWTIWTISSISEQNSTCFTYKINRCMYEHHFPEHDIIQTFHQLPPRGHRVIPRCANSTLYSIQRRPVKSLNTAPPATCGNSPEEAAHRSW